MKNNIVQKNIPQGWDLKNLGDLALIKKGEQLNRLNMISNGKYPALNGGISPSGYTNKWNTEASTITISEGGNSCGYVNFNKEKFWCGGHCYSLLNIKENVDKNFLYQILKFNQNRVMKLRVGSGLPNIQKRSVEKFSVIIPELLKEQQKIAKILGEVDEDIEKTEKIIQKTGELKKGLMQHIFTRGIGHNKFKKTKLGEIPEDWEVVKFEDIATVTNGQVDPKKEPYKSMVLIAPNYLETDSGSIIERKSADEQGAISGKYLVEKGDIIYSKIRPYLKKLTLADQKCLCSADMYPIKTFSNSNNKFLFYILLSKHFTDFANSLSARTGIPKINRTELNSYEFALPKLEEQKKIAEILSAVDEKILINKKLKEKLILLKKGLMQDLLSGKVRVAIER